jgi:hypothetical protein
LGVAAAYRANAFSIIAGRFWNRQTTKIGTNPDGTDQIKKGYKGAWQVGVGFDLTTAKDWLTSNSGDKKGSDKKSTNGKGSDNGQ